MFEIKRSHSKIKCTINVHQLLIFHLAEVLGLPTMKGGAFPENKMSMFYNNLLIYQGNFAVL